VNEIQQPTPGAVEAVKAEDQDPPASPWRAQERTLDVFWLVLTAILVAAVVFVVSVAHTSMNEVGTVADPHPPASTALTTAGASETIVIVQVSSYRSQVKARDAAADLDDRGFQAQVLDSDEYSPMNRGWYVVYTGPYPDTETGRAEAKRVASRLPEAFTRDVRRKG
jgi:septal ring-binding cell division protein DamX